jgi:hypothetical protein
VISKEKVKLAGGMKITLIEQAQPTHLPDRSEENNFIIERIEKFH